MPLKWGGWVGENKNEKMEGGGWGPGLVCAKGHCALHKQAGSRAAAEILHDVLGLRGGVIFCFTPTQSCLLGPRARVQSGNVSGMSACRACPRVYGKVIIRELVDRAPPAPACFRPGRAVASGFQSSLSRKP